jgi:hypothetical protein
MLSAISCNRRKGPALACFVPPGSPPDCIFPAISRNRLTRGAGAPENSHQFSLSSLVRADRLSRSVDRSQSASEGEFLGWAMVGWELFRARGLIKKRRPGLALACSRRPLPVPVGRLHRASEGLPSLVRADRSGSRGPITQRKRGQILGVAGGVEPGSSTGCIASATRGVDARGDRHVPVK